MINHVQQPHLETSSLKLHECELVITIYDGYETEGGVNFFFGRILWCARIESLNLSYFR